MYKYDLHVHSSGGSACGGGTVEEMIKRNKEIGFAGFVLTIILGDNNGFTKTQNNKIKRL